MTHTTGHRADELSFVSLNPAEVGGYNYWNVAPSGRWSEDCETGRHLGVEFLSYVGRHPTNGNATLLPQIVNSMIAARKDAEPRYGDRYTTGCELGFLSAVGEYAMATAKVIERQNAAA